jgi:hypothetical protein
VGKRGRLRTAKARLTVPTTTGSAAGEPSWGEAGYQRATWGEGEHTTQAEGVSSGHPPEHEQKSGN